MTGYDALRLYPRPVACEACRHRAHKKTGRCPDESSSWLDPYAMASRGSACAGYGNQPRRSASSGGRKPCPHI
jgi:hypothetical protein